jgi:hypothetical protein
MRDHGSGSGLTANWTNQPNASGLYLAFDRSSCSPRPALCYRPLPAFSPSSCDAESDLARAPDAAPTGKTSEVVKERVCFTPSIFAVNRKCMVACACNSVGCRQFTGGCSRICAGAGRNTYESRLDRALMGGTANSRCGWRLRRIVEIQGKRLWAMVSAPFLSPLRGSINFYFYPRLTPWALF